MKLDNKHKSILFVFIIVVVSVFLIATATALTFTSLGGGKYNVTFNSGTQATVSNITYNTQAKTMTIYVNVTNRKGLLIQDVIEAKEYGQTVNGKAKQYDKNIIEIN